MLEVRCDREFAGSGLRIVFSIPANSLTKPEEIDCFCLRGRLRDGRYVGNPIAECSDPLLSSKSTGMQFPWLSRWSSLYWFHYAAASPEGLQDIRRLLSDLQLSTEI